MIFYWLLLLLLIASYCYVIFKVITKKVGTRFDARKEYAMKHKKIILLGFLVPIILATFILHKPLGKTIWCTYKGFEHHVETKRDWISGVCSYKGTNDSWIPITRLLGLPEEDVKSIQYTSK